MGSVISSTSSGSDDVDVVLIAEYADDRLLSSLLVVDDRRLDKRVRKLTDMSYN